MTVNSTNDPLIIGGRKFDSRLIMGTGGAANLAVLERRYLRDLRNDALIEFK